MENGFVSPRLEAFPAGLRVLVVDDDPTWLKILEKMLRKCSYEVTTCGLARVALDMLRERKDRFDIVISDVNMPDMDGFKLLEHVGLEMDLPVIMMSVDGETSRVMKGVHHGACDYLLKPVRMKELRNIWQHVLRKKIHEVKGIESHDSSEDMQLMRNGSDEFDDGHSQSGCDLNLAKKRKDMENEEYDEHEFNDPSAVKKARVVWSVDLHQKFVNAVNQIGFDKVGPKKILDLMNVPGLTRENVASHLQKYRLYLSRLQQQNELKTSFGGITQSELSSKETTAGNFGHQSSITMFQNNAVNSFGCSSNQIVVRDMVSEILEDDLKSMISKFPVTYTKKALGSDVPNTQKVNVVSQIGQVLSFSGMVPSFESTISEQKPWSGEIPVMQFMQHPKQDRETYLRLEQGFSHLQLPSQQHHIRVDLLQTTPSVCVRTSITDRDKKGPSQTKPSCTDYKSPIDSFSVQLQHDIVNTRDSVATSIISGSPGTKNHDLVQTRVNDLESLSQNSILKNGSALAPSYDNLQQLCSLQAYGCFESFGLNGMEFFDYNDSASITDLQSHLYDGLRFNYDYLIDSMEYPVIEEGLFIS